MAICRQCGATNPPAHRICSECGERLQPKDGPKPAGLNKTVLGIPAVRPGDEPAAKPAPGAAPPGGAGGLNRTMLGMPTPSPAPSDEKTEATATPPAAPGAETRGPGIGRERGPAGNDTPMPEAKRQKSTLLGIARPGIAPSGPRGPSPPAAGTSPEEAQQPMPLPHAGDRPKPSPPQDDQEIRVRGLTPRKERQGPSPAPSAHQRRSGPWRTIVLFGLALAAAAGLGAGLALLSPKPPRVKVESFRVGEDGSDILTLACDRCTNETTIRGSGGQARFEDGRAELQLAESLDVGANHLVFDMSGVHDGDVEVVVPVAFRVRTDLEGRAQTPPFARVVVDVPPNSKVVIEGREIPIEQGRAVYRLSYPERARGEHEDEIPIEETVSIEVATPELSKKTTAQLRTAISPLLLDMPGPRHVLSGHPLHVSGRTSPLARVSAAGAETKADENGLFGLQVQDPTPGPLEIRAVGPGELGRTHTVELLPEDSRPEAPRRRLDELEDGEQAIIEGVLVESRVVEGQTSLIVEAEPCAQAPCLLRVVHAEAQEELKPGQRLRLLGSRTPTIPPTFRAARITPL